MTLVPFATVVILPLLPAALEIVATAGVPEDQATESVRSCLVESEYSPVAVRVTVVPRASDGVGGVMEIESSTALETVSVAVSVIVLDAAVIRLSPSATPLARPFAPTTLEIVAMVVVPDVHTTV